MNFVTFDSVKTDVHPQHAVPEINTHSVVSARRCGANIGEVRRQISEVGIESKWRSPSKYPFPEALIRAQTCGAA